MKTNEEIYLYITIIILITLCVFLFAIVLVFTSKPNPQPKITTIKRPLNIDDPKFKDKIIEILEGEFLKVQDNNIFYPYTHQSKSLNIFRVINFILGNFKTLEMIIAEYNIRSDNRKNEVASKMSDEELVMFDLLEYKKGKDKK